MKKVKIIFYVVTLLLIFNISVNAESIQSPEQAANFLRENSLLQGDENGDLMLSSKLTREQIIVILSRLSGKESEAVNYPTDSLTFTDVPQNDKYAPYIAWAKANNITQGYYKNKFGFNDSLTDWQAEAFMVRVLGYVDTVEADIEKKADELGITNSSPASSSLPISRGEMAVLMYNTLFSKNINGNLLGEELGIIGDNLFEMDNLKVGDTISDMAVTAISASNPVSIDFSGEKAISGDFKFISEDEILFTLDNYYSSMLPKIKGYIGNMNIIIYTNPMLNVLGAPGCEGKASLIIDTITVQKVNDHFVVSANISDIIEAESVVYY